MRTTLEIYNSVEPDSIKTIRRKRKNGVFAVELIKKLRKLDSELTDEMCIDILRKYKI